MVGWCARAILHVTVECELRSSFTGGIPPRRHRHPTCGAAGERGGARRKEEHRQDSGALARPVFGGRPAGFGGSAGQSWGRPGRRGGRRAAHHLPGAETYLHVAGVDSLSWRGELGKDDAFGLLPSPLHCTAHHHLAPDAECRCCLDPASGATSNPEPASALMRPPPPLCARCLSADAPTSSPLRPLMRPAR